MITRGIFIRTKIHEKKDWKLVAELPIGSRLDLYMVPNGHLLYKLQPGEEYSLGTKHNTRFIKSHKVVVTDIDNVRHLLIQSKSDILYAYILRDRCIEPVVLID